MIYNIDLQYRLLTAKKCLFNYFLYQLKHWICKKSTTLVAKKGHVKLFIKVGRDWRGSFPILAQKSHMNKNPGYVCWIHKKFTLNELVRALNSLFFYELFLLFMRYHSDVLQWLWILYNEMKAPIVFESCLKFTNLAPSMYTLIRLLTKMLIDCPVAKFFLWEVISCGSITL